MSFMRLFKGLTKMMATPEPHPQLQHIRKTLVLYTPIREGLGVSDTIYSEAKKFEIYAIAPGLWNIDIQSFELDRAHTPDGKATDISFNIPRRWYPDGFLARHVSASDTQQLLQPYLSTHNFTTLRLFLKNDPWVLDPENVAIAAHNGTLR